MKEPGRMRWVSQEYMAMAAAALPLMDADTNPFTVLGKAQQIALPRERWRSEEEIEKVSKSSTSKKTMAEALKRVRRMGVKARAKLLLPEGERPAIVDEPVPERPAQVEPPPGVYMPSGVFKKPKQHHKEDADRDYGNGPGVRTTWTDREEALLARRIKCWLDAGATASLARLFIEAQEIELPVDRRRSLISLKKADNASATKGRVGSRQSNKAHYEDGLAHQMLVQRWPFDPMRSTYEEVEPVDFVESANVVHEPAEEAAPEAAQEAPEAFQATTPPPTSRSSIQGAIEAFGERLKTGLDELIATVIRQTQEETIARMQAHIDRAIKAGTESFMEHLQAGIASRVRAALEAELGGPVAEAEPDVPAARPRAPKLAVDVIGLIGPQVSIVKQAINGHADIRFIEAGRVREWTPRTDHVILLTKFISHDAQEKVKAAGIKPIWINGAAPAVIHAIEALAQAPA